MTASAADWLALGSATLGESGARQMHPRIKPVWPGARVAGPVLPVRCAPGDNLALHAAVASVGAAGAAPAAAPAPAGPAPAGPVTAAPAPAGAGVVLVVDASAVPALGYWGEVLTTGAQARGIAGLVIDAGVRDVDALEAHGFPVFSALVALPGATKVAGGAYGAPVSVGDVDVQPGDWVVGDRDGVVVVPRDSLDAVLEAGRARAAKEAHMFDQLRAGATTVGLLSLDVTRLDPP